MPNLDAGGRERFLTIYNPLNPPGVGWVKTKFAKFGRGPTAVSKKCLLNLEVDECF